MKSYRKKFDYSTESVAKLHIDGVEVRVEFSPRSRMLNIGTYCAEKRVAGQASMLKPKGKFVRREFTCPKTNVEVVVDVCVNEPCAIMVVSK